MSFGKIDENSSGDWYGETGAEVAAASDAAAQQFSMGTPRLTIVSMATPRSADDAGDGQGGTTGFVPYWPYSSQWPFCRAPTTLEAKGLPKTLTARALIVQLNAWGFVSRCNYVEVSGGVAVINTERHSDGCALAAKLHGFSQWQDSKSPKPCRVAWSFTKQGLDDLHMQQHYDAWQEDGQYNGPWMLAHGSWMPTVEPPSEDGSVWVPSWVAVE